MKRTKRLFFLALFAMLATAATASALQREGFTPAKVNPEFIRYLEELESGKAEGRIPPKAYLSAQSADTSKHAAARAAALPASFDLVSKGWVTGVKSQRSWGTCWDFATMETIESNLKKETGAEDELSELHLGFFAYYDESLEKPAYDATAKSGDNKIFDNGGTTYKARAILTRGTGPVLDKDAPYPTVDAADKAFWKNYPEDPEALKRELLAAPNAFRLKESLSFHTSDDIKRALMEYGGLWIGFNANAVAENRQDPYIYTSADKTMNHAVMLVGWDDNLSRDLFVGPNAGYKSPDIDGGWKIQNSWGLSRDINEQEVTMGDDGYYWISYADASIFGDIGASSFIASADNWQHTYLHDPLGEVYGIDTPFTAVETANVFKAERNEDLVCVGFTTTGFDVDYGIQVYRNIPEDGEPDDGTPVFQTPQSGTADFPGYRTVALTSPVPLDRGERFAVVVTLESDNSIEIPVEAAIDNFSSKATAGAGESYVRTPDDDEWDEVRTYSDSYTDSNGKFHEVRCTNLTIKAFTNDANRGSSGSNGCQTGAFALLFVALIPIALRRR